MVRKIMFITTRTWFKIPLDVRRGIRAAGIKKPDIINKMYVATLENELRVRGRHDVANMLVAGDEE